MNFIDIAFQEAEAAAARGEVPVGACIADPATGRVVARAGNRTLELNDPTAHAEILAIRDACRNAGAQRIPELELYVTLEPCTMCAASISFARIKRVVFGAADAKGGAVISGVRFFDQPTCHHRPVVEGPVDGARCGDILRDFFKDRR